MKWLMILLLMSQQIATADDQGELISNKKAKYRMGDSVVFELDPFYSKACRDPRILGIKKLGEHQTVGKVDQFYDGTYRIIKVYCDSERIYGYHHFNVTESEIVGIYTPLEIKKDKGASLWWLLWIGIPIIVGIPIFL